MNSFTREGTGFEIHEEIGGISERKKKAGFWENDQWQREATKADITRLNKRLNI